MKQTAVEWLIKKLQNRENGIFDGLPHLSVEQIYLQAKQMEIEQIRRAFCHGEVARDRIDSMEYYNETYGK
jgi:hypothetical protein